jgi:uncharacterized membrane protein
MFGKYLSCHQIPERCFKINGKPMPFCARCFGCSIGHVLVFVLFLTGILFLAGTLPALLIAASGMVVMFVDWSIQNHFKLVSNNYSRFITGILGGGGIGIFIWTFISFGLNHL